MQKEAHTDTQTDRHLEDRNKETYKKLAGGHPGRQKIKLTRRQQKQTESQRDRQANVQTY